MLEGAFLFMMAVSQGIILWTSHRAHKDAEKIVAAGIARNPQEYAAVLNTLDKPKKSDRRPRAAAELPIGL